MMYRFIPFFLCSLSSIHLLGQANFQEVSADNPIFESDHSFHGVSVVDYDNDGDQDFYVSTITGGQPNKLFRNECNFIFTDQSDASGLDIAANSMSSVWFDADNDGWLDLFVVGLSKNHFFKNNTDGSFEQITHLTGLDLKSNTRALLVADLNGDQWPDIFSHNAHSYESSLFMNDEQFHFTEQIANSGISSIGLPAMGAVFVDIDEDGDQDLYCIYDNDHPYKFYRNDGNAVFQEVSESLNLDYQGDGMGVDFADYNRDGLTDFYISNLYPNALMLQQADGTFLDESQSWGVADEGMGWGIVNFDYDNDSYTDIFMVNSQHPFSKVEFSNKLFRNIDGSSFQSVDQGSPLGVFRDSFSCASADFDGDGLLDLVVVGANGNGIQLFRNQETAGNFLQLNLIGTSSNKYAIGARIECWIDGKVQKDEVTAGSGYSAQNGYTIQFGLGEAVVIDSLVVYWPDQLIEKHYSITANQKLAIVQNGAIQNFDPQLYTNTVFTGSVLLSKLEALPKFEVYPNPAEDLLHVSGLEEYDGGSILIIDVQGRLLFQKEYAIFESLIKLDLSSLKPGMLVLQVITKDAQMSKVIVRL